jgi:hypothetical protein
MGFAADDPQRLSPLGDIADIRVQRLHHGYKQVGVHPAPAGLETVCDGIFPRHVGGGPTRGAPRGVDPIGDALIGRVASPHLQKPQILHNIIEVAGPPWIGRHREAVSCRNDRR